MKILKLSNFSELITILGMTALSVGSASARQAEERAEASSRSVRVSLAGKDWAPTPIDLVHGGVFFQAIVGGRTVWALLDNGLDRSTIDTGLARVLGLPEQVDPGSLKTVAGPLRTKLVRGVTVAIPRQVTFRDDLVGVNLSPLSRRLGRRIGLVLGNDYLASLACYIDTRNMWLYLRRSGSITPTKAATRVSLIDGRMINVTINKFPVRLKIDFGFNATIQLSDLAWQRIVGAAGLSQSTQEIDAAGREITTMLAQEKRLMIAGISATLPVSTQHTRIPGADGSIGMGFFRHFNTIMDTAKGEMWLIPHETGQTNHVFGYTS